MSFTISATLLDSCVLAQLADRDSYGYEITNELSTSLNVSESTIYPVLRRLLTNGLLTTYDQPYQGRMRRYYSISKEGTVCLAEYRREWKQFSGNINRLLGEEK